VITANSPDLLSDAVKEDLTPVEQDATVQRILYLEADAAAAEYLAALNATRPGDNVADVWIREDLLARHALWLAANRKVVPGERFLVEGHRQKLHALMSTNSRTGKQIMEVLARCLMDHASRGTGPGSPTHVHKDRLYIGSGHVLIHYSAVAGLWETYFPDNLRDRPSPMALSRALSTIAHEGDFRPRIGGRQVRLWDIKVDVVAEWAHEAGMFDRADMLAVVAGESSKVDELMQGAA